MGMIYSVICQCWNLFATLRRGSQLAIKIAVWILCYRPNHYGRKIIKLWSQWNYNHYGHSVIYEKTQYLNMVCLLKTPTWLDHYSLIINSISCTYVQIIKRFMGRNAQPVYKFQSDSKSFTKLFLFLKACSTKPSCKVAPQCVRGRCKRSLERRLWWLPRSLVAPLKIWMKCWSSWIQFQRWTSRHPRRQNRVIPTRFVENRAFKNTEVVC